MITKITSAYNFVPTSRQVVQPDWQGLASHDIPLKDGYCAEIDITLTNDTPLLIGAPRAQHAGDQPALVEFYKHPDGVPAIPGSSLRGMLRNVLEIATGSEMYRVDDQRLSVRDLTHRDLYTKKFTEPMSGHRGSVKPLTRSAWLRFNNGQWQLAHVLHVRVEQDVIARDLGIDLKRWFREKNLRDPESKYTYVVGEMRKRHSEKPRAPLTVYFSKEEAVKEDLHEHRNRTLKIAYRKVQTLCANPSESCKVEGRLVVTGQPGPSKHMEFVFVPPPQNDEAWFTVQEDLIQDFLQINDTEATILAWFRSGKGPFSLKDGIPVFYLCRQPDVPRARASDDVLAIGMAQMFRLPYATSIRQAIQNGQAPATGLDFAQTLFGLVADEKTSGNAVSRKGRISMGDLRLEASTESVAAATAFSEPTVLNGPKPSYYPNYIVQREASGRVDHYQTLMDHTVHVRGWKRYPVHKPDEVKGVPAPPQGAGASVTTKLRPLRKGLTFCGRVRLHNVTAQELGAVLWGLTWGGNARLRHAIGMGKPLGLGQVRIDITELQVRPNDPGRVDDSTDIASFLKQFEAWIQKANPNWSTDIKELLAMADPGSRGSSALRPMYLGMNGTNEFKDAKREKLALLPYSRM